MMGHVDKGDRRNMKEIAPTTQSSSTSPALDRFYEVASESWDV
eukprot:CAMPEP_0170195138 /NCGR_PEP_ID=MMETSP0040_2-20121228/60840_1 /TAXON_ID=641309 /ORGANISM="Lotharella oceanica, Strain CCMP622" /LENGTH=42 /DNA_ID= /DNA_START= /DNA_END= /DNA_ORIENTATION=